jgi:hypothetical protein
MNKSQLLVVVILTSLIGICLGIGLSSFIVNSQYKGNAKTTKNENISLQETKTPEISNTNKTIVPPTSQTLPVQPQVTQNTNLVTKECLGISFSYDSSKLQIGYTGVSSGGGTETERKSYLDKVKNINCDSLSQTYNSAEDYLRIFPKDFNLGCYGCDFQPLYIIINSGIGSKEEQFYFETNKKDFTANGKIVGVSYDYYNNEEGIQFFRKGKIVSINQNNRVINIVLILDRIASFNKTEAEAIADFDTIVSSIKL